MGFMSALDKSVAAILARYEDSSLPRPTRAVCLALGTFARSNDGGSERAGAQLAAFVRLLDIFGIDTNKTSVKCHDPRFTGEDEAFLRSLGFDLPGSSEEAKTDLVCDEPTLLFLPFLPFPVHELIYQLNWSPARLKNIVMVAPQLEGWLDDHIWFRHMTEAYIPRTQRCLPLCELETLPTVEDCRVSLIASGKEDTFAEDRCYGLNEMYLRWIPPSRLAAVGARFWAVKKRDDSRWVHLATSDEKDEWVKDAQEAENETGRDRLDGEPWLLVKRPRMLARAKL